MKKIIFSSVLCFITFFTFAQNDGHNHAIPVNKMVEPQAAPVSPATNASKVLSADVKKVEETLVLKEDIYDFGKIPQGKPVTHIFEVTNVGKSPLKIANVQASCGCTTPEWDKDKEIPAGTDSKITVGYNAAAEGPFSKLVTITYNESQTKQITIKGEVWKTPASSAPVNEGLNDLKN